MSSVDGLLLAVGLTVLLLGLLSGLLRRSMMSENLLALVAGIILGPAVLGLLDPGELTDRAIEEVARVTLAIGLMGVALRLPPGEPERHAKSLGVLLFLVMPAMWIVTALLVHLLLGLPWVLSFLVGAVLTPTDPVVVSTVVTGRLAEHHVPARLRHVLSSESGFNDGLSVPFVMFPILLAAAPGAREVGLWLLEVFGYEIIGGAVLGAALGYAAGWLLEWADRHHAVEKSSLLAYALALSVVILGAGSLVGVQPLLAVFVGGLAFDRVVTGQERKTEAGVQEAIHRFFSIPIFLLLGMALPWQAWLDLGWAALALAVAVLLLRRLPAVLLFGWLMPDVRRLSERLFAGWFGPMGVATLYLAGLAFRRTGSEEVVAIAALLVVASVVAHGITAAPWIKRLG